MNDKLNKKQQIYAAATTAALAVDPALDRIAMRNAMLAAAQEADVHRADSEYFQSTFIGTITHIQHLGGFKAVSELQEKVAVAADAAAAAPKAPLPVAA